MTSHHSHPSDTLLDSESWLRGLGKFLIVSLYTSYVLSSTQTSGPLALFTAGCRGVEVVVMLGAYARYLMGYVDLEESFGW